MYTLGQVLLGFAAFVCLLFGVVGLTDDFTRGVGVFSSACGILCIVAILRRRNKRKQNKKTTIQAPASPKEADNINVTKTGDDINFEMGGESIPIASIHINHIDTDENVPTPPGSKLNYLDAEALKFWNNKQTDFVIPPYYQNTAFGRNVSPALDRLLEEGYLDFGGIDKNIALKTVPEIKAVLADKGLKVSGKKSDLIRRLIDNVDPYELEALFPVGVYVMTPKGEAALNPYAIIEANDRHALHIPYYKLMAERSAHPEEDDNDTLKRILITDANNHIKTDDESGYLETILTLARFLRDIGEPEQAFQYYAISYFLWALDARKLGIDETAQGYYQAKFIDECGKLCGYSADELIDKLQTVIVSANPFDLATGYNVKYAVKLLRKNLGIK